RCPVFLPTRPLPRSTLFPYTTLFRSHQPSPGEVVEADRLSRQLPWPPAGQRRDLRAEQDALGRQGHGGQGHPGIAGRPVLVALVDRKSTRLNSSHVSISYAVFCLKKK